MITGSFPSEIILHIYRFLPTASQFSLAKCCHLLNEISRDHFLWRQPLRSMHHLHESPLPEANKQNFKLRYERIFSEVRFLLANEVNISALGENHPEQLQQIHQGMQHLNELLNNLNKTYLSTQFIQINELLSYINTQIIQMQLPLPGAAPKHLKLECITRLPGQIISDNVAIFSCLQNLELKDNFLEEIPSTIGLCQKLESLNVYDNPISFVPTTLATLSMLKFLYFSGGNFGTIPAVICQLKNLLWLSLANMNISSLPKEIKQLRKLTWLYLANNHINELPVELSQLAQLQYLNLQNNQLSLRQPHEVVQLMHRLRIEVPWLFVSQERSSFDQTLIEESDIEGLINHFGLLAITPRFNQAKQNDLKRIQSTPDLLQAGLPVRIITQPDANQHMV